MSVSLDLSVLLGPGRVPAGEPVRLRGAVCLTVEAPSPSHAVDLVVAVEAGALKGGSPQDGGPEEPAAPAVLSGSALGLRDADRLTVVTAPPGADVSELLCSALGSWGEGPSPRRRGLVVVTHDGSATDDASMAEVASAILGRGVVSSVVGVGEGFDEVLVSSLADGLWADLSLARCDDEVTVRVRSALARCRRVLAPRLTLELRPVREATFRRDDVPWVPAEGGEVVLGPVLAGGRFTVPVDLVVPPRGAGEVRALRALCRLVADGAEGVEADAAGVVHFVAGPVGDDGGGGVALVRFEEARASGELRTIVELVRDGGLTAASAAGRLAALAGRLDRRGAVEAGRFVRTVGEVVATGGAPSSLVKDVIVLCRRVRDGDGTWVPGDLVPGPG